MNDLKFAENTQINERNFVKRKTNIKIFSTKFTFLMLQKNFCHILEVMCFVDFAIFDNKKK